MDYETAYRIVTDAQHEGGYVNDPADPGGETYKGVARKMNPTWAGWAHIDAARGAGFPANLEADAVLQGCVKSFYQFSYWGPAGCDAVPDVLKFELFDFAINTSAPGRPATAIKCLQRAVGADVDGVLGPNTLLHVNSLAPAALFRKFAAQVIRYYTGLDPTLRARYLGGWMNRLATNLERDA